MKKQRLFSSDEILNALLRCGFQQARKSKGSHQTLKRQRPDGTHDVTVVPIGKKEVPIGTLHNLLKLANVDYEDFVTVAKVKRKGKKRSK